MLAGDYCCYQKAGTRATPEANLHAALANLDLVGAVTLSERMPESLQVHAMQCVACMPLCRWVEGEQMPRGSLTHSPHWTLPLPVQYLDWLLGYNSGDTGFDENKNTYGSNFTDAEITAATALLEEDAVLYRHGMQRLQQQLAVMGVHHVDGAATTASSTEAAAAAQQATDR